MNIFLIALGIPFSSFSQSFTGNIVEYFGKEKINNIGEGDLLHIFNSGLLLPYTEGPDQSSTFPDNTVIRAFLADPFANIGEGDVFDVDFSGNAIKWEPITTDSTNTFSDARLRRSGYLYLTYVAPKEETVIFEGSGHTQILINGYPHEGDHYDFGHSLIPVRLKKGKNTFLLTPGRFPRMRARLITPDNGLLLTTRDMTLPDLLLEEEVAYQGGVRIVNCTGGIAKRLTIHCEIGDKKVDTPVRDLSQLNSAKLPFYIPYPLEKSESEQEMSISLIDNEGKVIHKVSNKINVKSNANHHKRTFISGIDGSVQYFSVAPSTSHDEEGQALFLSVHGASVEAVNQANAYKKKDWGTLIAPTNRRPFGYAWEDWGRIDAMEVLAEGKKIYNPDKNKIYLTGHSMGGHGTWYLGVTYPDHFAAIAPCAGYPDLLLYREYYRNRLLESPEMRQRIGVTDRQLKRMFREVAPTMVESLIDRAGNPSRSLKLKRNYLQMGVYILHGEKDDVVPTAIARDMRQTLGVFHPDFTYYEYPEGTHWYGDHSVDWPPIFDFFQARTIPESSEIDDFEFYTASPGVSASSHFVTIHQQIKAFEISKIKVERQENYVSIETDNIYAFSVDVEKMGEKPGKIEIDGQEISLSSLQPMVYFCYKDGAWREAEKLSLAQKGPHRSGGFKDAFNNNVVLVYGTIGGAAAQDWNYNRARFDAETFWYRANGNIPIIKDVDFKAGNYQGRNVVIYGNKSNNQAWDALLRHAPVQFSDNTWSIGDVTMKGDQWGALFIFPRQDDPKCSIGVVTSTGMKGSQATYNNNYLMNGTTFPDFLLFDNSVLTDGVDGVKCAGFFGNDWSIEGGEFEWR